MVRNEKSHLISLSIYVCKFFKYEAAIFLRNLCSFYCTCAGNLAAFSARVSPKPEAAASNDEKRAPVEDSDSVKPPSGGFLGRDTIANAAARIGPAVVNLSVPQGFTSLLIVLFLAVG